MKKRAILTVTNDLGTDQRLARIARTLAAQGYEVTLVGRELRNSGPLPELPFRMIRFKLPFEKGPLFYLSYALRCFFSLLGRKADLIWANDLDTLIAAYPAARLKRVPLIYDSHELFTEVPELEGKKLKKGIWKRAEKRILPRLPFMLTVNPSIAAVYEGLYGIPVHVLPNHPEREKLRDIEWNKDRKALGLPEDRFILVLQGSGINVGRGGEEVVEGMKELDDGYQLLIIGRGDVIGTLKQRSEELQLGERIRFLDPMPYAEMMRYTHNADLGLSLDKPVSENYRLSSPNKLFDYIHAGTPVLASQGLPEVERILKEHGVGTHTDPKDPKAIAEAVRSLKMDPGTMSKYRENCRQAAEELSWERNGIPVIQRVLEEIKG